MSDSHRPSVIYLSPHFDDVALSCGGSVAMDAEDGRVTIVTVFAGRPPGELNSFAQFQHNRWGTSENTVDERRVEDAAAMIALNAQPRWLDFPDAIYRDDLYLSDADLFGDVKSGDSATARRLSDALIELVEEIRPTRMYAPLSAGGHVDHRLARNAALASRRAGLELFLYEDFPYAASDGAVERAIADLDRSTEPLYVDMTRVMSKRLAAIAAYSSQLTTIFRHYGTWDDVVRAYARRLSGDAGGYAERFWRVG